MNLPTLLLPPLRQIESSTPERLAATPVWVVSDAECQASTLGAWRGHRIDLWLDSADVLLLSRKLPDLPARLLRQALPNALEDAVAGDVGELLCTSGPVSTDGFRWIAAIHRPALEPLLKALRGIEICVDQVGTPALALLDPSAGAATWPNPVATDELRWAARVGNNPLGGDAALGEALGLAYPHGVSLPPPGHMPWNLIGDLAIERAFWQGAWFNPVRERLQVLGRSAMWLTIPLIVFLIGLGLDTTRLSLEKRRLAAIPGQLYQGLFADQPMPEDAYKQLRQQFDSLADQADAGSGARQLLPLLDAAAHLRLQLPDRPRVTRTEFSAGRLILRFAVPPAQQPTVIGNFSVQWRDEGLEALITPREGA